MNLIEWVLKYLKYRPKSSTEVDVEELLELVLKLIFIEMQGKVLEEGAPEAQSLGKDRMDSSIGLLD